MRYNSMRMIKGLCVLLFLIGAWYMIIPIEAGSRLTDAIVTEYTNNRRSDVTSYYIQEFKQFYCMDFAFYNFFCLFNPLKINHSPTLVASYFDPKQRSTYLEEYFYPLRGSIVVNGYEPYDARGRTFNKFSAPLLYKGKGYASQISIRYYNSSVYARLLIYFLIWLSIYFVVKLFRKIPDLW